MTDIVQELNAGCDHLLDEDNAAKKCNAYLMGLCQDAAHEIERLREDSFGWVKAWNAKAKELAASQAREAKLREALEVHARWGTGQGPKIEAAIQALALPTDDTALQEVIRQAKRETLLEMLLEVVDCLSPCDAGEFICDELRNWAEELK